MKSVKIGNRWYKAFRAEANGKLVLVFVKMRIIVGDKGVYVPGSKTWLTCDNPLSDKEKQAIEEAWEKGGVDLG